MYVLALRVDLHLPEARSLKSKRAVLRPLVDGARRRFGVAVAEVDHHDQWQRAEIGIAVVANTATHAEEVIDEVERWIWSTPDLQVLNVDRHWLELDR
ncbi:MAG TPA: DUF503 domain-containing protein [Acidimicrobiales bacterium]|nr:DUF503 domain-containing protein [Acidimicrobiales bacterium]